MTDRVDQLEWDMKMIKDKTPYAAIQYIRKHMGYDEFLVIHSLQVADRLYQSETTYHEQSEASPNHVIGMTPATPSIASTMLTPGTIPNNGRLHHSC